MMKNTNPSHNIFRKLICLCVPCICALILTGCHKHEFRPATCTSPSACIKCGESQGTPLGHAYVDATCTEPQYCSRCNATFGEPAGHNFSEATCEEPKTCTVCGKKDGVPLRHSYVKGDCTKDTVCSRCNKTVPAPGHNYRDATCTEPATCIKCGATKGTATGHTFKNGLCINCKIADFPAKEAIASICNTQATCQTDYQFCLINVNEDHNPYDVVFDYGEDYQKYVDACDWSLIFDPAYYKKTFPMLAMLYHNNDELLLEHFQTVGIHEGRQGNASFNVFCYYYNCDKPIYDTFQQNYEGYYFYYMLHYDQEKDVNTTSVSNGKAIKKQIKTELTAVQKEELKGINTYRKKVNSPEVTYDSELQALACYRSYLNSFDNWDAHDWTIQNDSTIRKIIDDCFHPSAFGFAENNVTYKRTSPHIYVSANHRKYFESPEHYEAMVKARYKYTGVSNVYIGRNEQKHCTVSEKYLGAQFDVYLKSLSTALNP